MAKIGQHVLKDCIIYNTDWYMDFCGHKYPFGAKHFNSTTLKPETEMIKEVWVHLDEGFGTFDDEDAFSDVYIASSVFQVNNNRAVIGILNSYKEVIKVTNLKVSTTQCIDLVGVQKAEFSTSNSTENILSQKRRVRELTGTNHMAERNISVMLNI